MSLNITVGLRDNDPEPRTTWIDDTAVLEVRPHLSLILNHVEAAERLRDALSEIIDGFRGQASIWVEEQAEGERNDAVAVSGW